MRWNRALAVGAQLLQTPALPMLHALKVFSWWLLDALSVKIAYHLPFQIADFFGSCRLAIFRQVHFGIGRWHKKAGSRLENLVRWVYSEFCCFGTTTGNLAIQNMSYWYGVLSNYAVQLGIPWKTMGSVLWCPCANPDSSCFVKIIGSHNSARQSSHCEWWEQRKETLHERCQVRCLLRKQQYTLRRD